MTGSLDADALHEVVRRVEEALHDYRRVTIYVEVESLAWISFQALVLDMEETVAGWTRFELKAVVSESGWIDMLMPLVDRLFPSLEVRHFTPEERDEALSWVRG